MIATLLFAVGPTSQGAEPWVNDFLDACRAARLSLKEAAYTMQIDQAQLSRCFHGEARLSLSHLARLPAAFHQEYAAQLAAHYGVPPRLSQGAWFALSVLLGGRRPMATMRAVVEARRRVS
jgi:hypothetical protein